MGGGCGGRAGSGHIRGPLNRWRFYVIDMPRMRVVFWEMRRCKVLVLLAACCARASVCARGWDYRCQLGYLVYGPQELYGSLGEIGSWGPNDKIELIKRGNDLLMCHLRCCLPLPGIVANTLYVYEVSVDGNPGAESELPA